MTRRVAIILVALPPLFGLGVEAVPVSLLGSCWAAMSCPRRTRVPRVSTGKGNAAIGMGDEQAFLDEPEPEVPSHSVSNSSTEGIDPSVKELEMENGKASVEQEAIGFGTPKDLSSSSVAAAGDDASSNGRLGFWQRLNPFRGPSKVDVLREEFLAALKQRHLQWEVQRKEDRAHHKEELAALHKELLQYIEAQRKEELAAFKQRCAELDRRVEGEQEAWQEQHAELASQCQALLQEKVDLQMENVDLSSQWRALLQEKVDLQMENVDLRIDVEKLERRLENTEEKASRACDMADKHEAILEEHAATLEKQGEDYSQLLEQYSQLLEQIQTHGQLLEQMQSCQVPQDLRDFLVWALWAHNKHVI